MSKWYRTDPSDPDAPVEVTRYPGTDIRRGCTVMYTGPVPLPGLHTVEAIHCFPGEGAQPPAWLAILDGGKYEVDPANLRRIV